MEELDKKTSEIVRSTVKEFMESFLKGEIQASLNRRKASGTDITNAIREQDLERSTI